MVYFFLLLPLHWATLKTIFFISTQSTRIYEIRSESNDKLLTPWEFHLKHCCSNYLSGGMVGGINHDTGNDSLRD